MKGHEVQQTPYMEPRPVGIGTPGVVGVRFRKSGRVHYFSPGSLELKVGEVMVAPTSQGEVQCFVIIAPTQLLQAEVAGPLETLLRKATLRDKLKHEESFQY